MLTAAIVVIHVIVSLLLVLLILLHSGRGGGLSDMFGGGIGASAELSVRLIRSCLSRQLRRTAERSGGLQSLATHEPIAR